MCSNRLVRLVWAIICRHQVLPEDFTIKNLFHVEMSIVFQYQKLSEKFILRYYKRAGAFNTLRYCNNLSISCIEEIMKNESYIAGIIYGLLYLNIKN